MDASLRTAAGLLLLGLAACAGQAGEGPSELDRRDQASTVTYRSQLPSLHLRGTMNGWEAAAMKLVGDDLWQGEASFPAGADGELKFDVYGDWRENYGDDQGDRIADLAGRNIAVPGGRTYLVTFNALSRYYAVDEKTYTATVVLQLPAGADAAAFSGQQAKVSRDGEAAWTVGLYADAEHAGPYCPLPGLTRGSSYRFALDLVVGGKRFLAEGEFSVDGAADAFDVPLAVTEGSLADYGTVELRVLSDRWQDGRLVSGGWADVGVYLGDWHAGHRLGTTDAEGRLTLTVPAGQPLFSAMVMTSSHSMASAEVSVAVAAGQVARAELRIAPVSVTIRAHARCDYGQALYLTGATGYLGDWKQARKMSYDPASGAWTLTQNLPLGLPFKIVRGPWVDGAALSTAEVEWEQGADRAVTPPQGSYDSVIYALPVF